MEEQQTWDESVSKCGCRYFGFGSNNGQAMEGKVLG